jgi:hypothetical protein
MDKSAILVVLVVVLGLLRLIQQVQLNVKPNVKLLTLLCGRHHLLFGMIQQEVRISNTIQNIHQPPSQHGVVHILGKMMLLLNASFYKEKTPLVRIHLEDRMLAMYAISLPLYLLMSLL